jgi:putative transposase
MTKIWIHAVWATKDRQPLLKKSFRAQIIRHIRERFQELSCYSPIVGGIEDHLHALFILNPESSIVRVIKMTKGESSHWINQQDFLKIKFAWQVGYGAFSVSESTVKDVKEYIKNQEKHHKKRTFQEEYEVFIRKPTT